MKKDFDFYRLFRNNLQVLRSQHGVTSNEMSLALGMAKYRISGFESSPSHKPTVEELFQIAEYFKVDVNDLIHKKTKITFE